MATDRKYIVCEEANSYLCIAKDYGGWEMGNVDLLNQFIKFFGDRKLIIGDETDEEFWDKHIKQGTNFNKTNKWEV